MADLLPKFCAINLISHPKTADKWTEWHPTCQPIKAILRSILAHKWSFIRNNVISECSESRHYVLSRVLYKKVHLNANRLRLITCETFYCRYSFLKLFLKIHRKSLVPLFRKNLTYLVLTYSYYLYLMKRFGFFLISFL